MEMQLTRASIEMARHEIAHAALCIDQHIPLLSVYAVRSGETRFQAIGPDLLPLRYTHHPKRTVEAVTKIVAVYIAPLALSLPLGRADRRCGEQYRTGWSALPASAPPWESISRAASRRVERWGMTIGLDHTIARLAEILAGRGGMTGEEFAQLYHAGLRVYGLERWESPARWRSPLSDPPAANAPPAAHARPRRAPILDLRVRTPANRTRSGVSFLAGRLPAASFGRRRTTPASIGALTGALPRPTSGRALEDAVDV